MIFGSPEPIGTQHRSADFDCGVETLDDWLKRRALANEVSGASRTFVVCSGDVVAGYYALAAGSLGVVEALGRFRRNMPDPIPIAILARLAVDRRFGGRGLGRSLFYDAARRIVGASSIVGIRGVIVHAISDDAKAFYLALGMEPSPLDPMTLMATLADISRAITN